MQVFPKLPFLTRPKVPSLTKKPVTRNTGVLAPLRADDREFCTPTGVLVSNGRFGLPTQVGAFTSVGVISVRAAPRKVRAGLSTPLHIYCKGWQAPRVCFSLGFS